MSEVRFNAPQRSLAVEFSASGSEYFRIWIVNLLLIVVSLGFYLPFAKARRLRYFYANTVIDGQPLAFHGDPWKMFRGYLVMLLLFGAYGLAGRFSKWAALMAFVLLAVLWPALWRSSLRFRLANTSWRGLRFGFAGSLAGAYSGMLMLALPVAVMLAANAWYFSYVEKGNRIAVKTATSAQLPWILGGALVLALLIPLALHRIKAYQHGGYRYARQVAVLDRGIDAFYKFFLKSLVVGCLVLAAYVAQLYLIAGGMFSLSGRSGGSVVLFGLLMAVVYLCALTLIGAYFLARLQDLTWGHTSSQALQFRSHLSGRALAHRQLVNLVLTVLSLGLYRPFAVVNTTALRMGAIRIELEGDLSDWQAGAVAVNASGQGEMSGDFFGFDLGL